MSTSESWTILTNVAEHLQVSGDTVVRWIPKQIHARRVEGVCGVVFDNNNIHHKEFCCFGLSDWDALRLPVCSDTTHQLSHNLEMAA